jgi:hypothetical protein
MTRRLTSWTIASVMALAALPGVGCGRAFGVAPRPCLATTRIEVTNNLNASIELRTGSGSEGTLVGTVVPTGHAVYSVAVSFDNPIRVFVLGRGGRQPPTAMQNDQIEVRTFCS